MFDPYPSVTPIEYLELQRKMLENQLFLFLTMSHFLGRPPKVDEPMGSINIHPCQLTAQAGTRYLAASPEISTNSWNHDDHPYRLIGGTKSMDSLEDPKPVVKDENTCWWSFTKQTNTRLLPSSLPHTPSSGVKRLRHGRFKDSPEGSKASKQLCKGGFINCGAFGP